MYEKLDKLRADVERCKQKIEDDKAKLKQAEARLQEAENTQILADVSALNLSPEQLAEFLKLVTAGKTGVANASAKFIGGSSEMEDDFNDDEKETEDFDDEEN